MLGAAAGAFGASDVDYYDEAGTAVVRASGEILDETSTELVLKTDNEELRIPAYRIEAVRYDKQPQEMLNIRNIENQNRYEDAVKEYEALLPQIDPTLQEFLHAAVRYAIFKNLAAAGMVDAAKLKPAIDWYEKNAESLAATRHFYPMTELAGRLYMAAEDYAKADEAFLKLKGVNWPGYKEKATLYQGLAALQRGKPVDAVLSFDDVLKSNVDSPVVREQKRIAKIAKADALVLSNKPADAEKLVREAIDELSLEDRVNYLARARNTLGDALAAQKREKEAVLDGYMWVHVLYNTDPNEHARAVYNLARLFDKIGYPDRAQQMAELLRTEFGRSQWAKKAGGA
jgi:tetratricopeptide (TPR) repeat protein